MADTDFIDVPIGTSRILAVILIGMYAAALVAMSALPIPLWLRVTGDVLLLASAALTIRRYALLKGPQACSRMRISNDGACRLELPTDRIAAGRLQPGWLDGQRRSRCGVGVAKGPAQDAQSRQPSAVEVRADRRIMAT